MKRINSILILSTLFSWQFFGLIWAQTISGSLSTSFYSWQQRDIQNETAQHVRGYQLAQLSVGNFGLPGLSFHTFINLSHDFAEQTVDDPRVWLYNCYLDYQSQSKTLNLSLGRQRIYAGVGYGTIDGVQANYRFSDFFKLKIYAGKLARISQSLQVNDLNADNLSWGFHLTSSKLRRINLGISYALHSRAPLPYKTPGIYTGNFRLDNPVSVMQNQLLGFDVQGYFTDKLRFHARLDYNLDDETVKRGQGGLRIDINNNFNLGLDYIYRTPYFDMNSIFSVFTFNPNQEVAVQANYQWKDCRFNINLAQVLFEGDNSLRLGFGGSWKEIYLSYFHRSGYGGENDGFQANYRHILNDKFNLSIGSNLASYRLYSTADKDFLFGSSLGIIYLPKKTLSLQVEAQWLNNKMFDRDVRLFFRGNYAFFHRF